MIMSKLWMDNQKPAKSDLRKCLKNGTFFGSISEKTPMNTYLFKMPGLDLNEIMMSFHSYDIGAERQTIFLSISSPSFFLKLN